MGTSELGCGSFDCDNDGEIDEQFKDLFPENQTGPCSQ